MSNFQRRHYEAIAKKLANGAPDAIIESFCDLFAGDNPNFDKDRFLSRINALRGNHISKHLCYHMVALWVDEINPMNRLGYFSFMERRGKPQSETKRRKETRKIWQTIVWMMKVGKSAR
jgi:hypothetical protein